MAKDNFSLVETSKASQGPDQSGNGDIAKPPLPAAAERALAEAAARRAALVRAKPTTTPEFCGRGGLEPVRYGDWEVKGIAYDF